MSTGSTLKSGIAAALGALALGGCTTLAQEDRDLLTAAHADAQAADAAAARAEAAAARAEAAATQAEAAYNRILQKP
jgi:hypothetical protein